MAKCIDCGSNIETISKDVLKILCSDCIMKKIGKMQTKQTNIIRNTDTYINEQNINQYIIQSQQLQKKAFKAYKNRNPKLFNQYQRKFETLKRQKNKYYIKKFRKKD